MPTRIRVITEFAELQRCLAFQHLIWGGDFAELVPAAILWAGVRTGGLVAGAFDDDDEMVGFLFGITGFVDGRPTHWSDMLGVLPRARGGGVGLALKRFQREFLLRHGVQHVAWTFDPLESRNAHLNFARLGITAREYIIDAYGQTTSPLHAGLSTDRLVASWSLSSERVRDRLDRGAKAPSRTAFSSAPVVNRDGAPDLSLDEPHLLIRIPHDIQALKQRDLAVAQQWRAATRAAFTTYFGRGYEAIELVRSENESCYVLARTSA